MWQKNKKHSFWLLNYNSDMFKGDVVAGMTVAVMLVPQSMAYALLAGLPAVHGLYASVVPLIVYALTGSSRQLAIGPIAMVSLLVATGVSNFAEPGSTVYIEYAILLAALSGLILFFMGWIRLGFLVNFISHPVISGFTSAAVLIIAFSQLRNLTGIPLDRSHHVHTILFQAFQEIDKLHWPTLTMGLSAIIMIVLIKKIFPVLPAPLTVVILGIGVVYGFHLDLYGIQIVGEIPRGFPKIRLPLLDLTLWEQLMPMALVIAFVNYMVSISIAKRFAIRNKYPIYPNQELFALGLANIVASLFQAYPVAGGFARTAVNAQAGAKSGAALLITAGMVGFVLLFLTPLFHYLPISVLAAIILVAVSGLFDFHEFFHLWKINAKDALMLFVTFIATLTLGIEKGILAGVILSLIMFLYRSSRPHYAILGRLRGTDIYRNIDRHLDAESIPGLVILRFDASFYFANVNFFKEKIQEILVRHDKDLKAILIDASSINSIDASADLALKEIDTDLKEQDILLLFANLKGPVRDVLRRSGFLDKLGRRAEFKSIRQAVIFYKQQMNLS